MAETQPSTGCFAKRAESVCTRLCPATELAGARVALLRCPILYTSAAIVLWIVKVQEATVIAAMQSFLQVQVPVQARTIPVVGLRYPTVLCSPVQVIPIDQ